LDGRMENDTLPSPSGGALFGGRKPASGSDGVTPVLGSMDLNRQDMTLLVAFRLASISTSSCFAGRRSTTAENSRVSNGTSTVRSPNRIVPRVNALTS